MRNGREGAWGAYNVARDQLISAPDILTNLEYTLAETVAATVAGFMEEAEEDYNAASDLYPFWEAYPPDQRGRQPVGDQYPWIEVGEHSIGVKLARSIAEHFDVRDVGFPTGADQRFVISGEAVQRATDGLTDTAWLCVDIKSVGPRDDFDHTVMSHNQISGSGQWNAFGEPIVNDEMVAVGARASHLFHPALPPLLVLRNGSVAPTITMALKPVYSMSPPDEAGRWTGQPLDRLHLITIPNGLLLTQNPNYLDLYPGLLFPGKDDKGKDPRKVRARVSFALLGAIDSWRCMKIWDSRG